MAFEAAGTPSGHRVATFNSNASIAHRLAAAQVAIDAALADAERQTRPAAYAYDTARLNADEPGNELSVRFRPRSSAFHFPPHEQIPGRLSSGDRRGESRRLRLAHSPQQRHAGCPQPDLDHQPS